MLGVTTVSLFYFLFQIRFPKIQTEPNSLDKYHSIRDLQLLQIKREFNYYI